MTENEMFLAALHITRVLARNPKQYTHRTKTELASVALDMLERVQWMRDNVGKSDEDMLPF